MAVIKRKYREQDLSQSTNELVTNVTSRSPRFGFISETRRTSANGDFSYFTCGARGSHDVKVGVQYQPAIAAPSLDKAI